MSDTPIRVTTAARTVRVHPAARALALSTLFAVLTATGAQIALRVPFTPVPVTLQVFFVLLSGALLGSRLGALSQIQYLGLGLTGLPIFAGGTTALTVLAGPTAGYLPGFVLAAWVVGRVVESAARPGAIRILAGMSAGIASIYLPGVLWLALWLHSVSGVAWAQALTAAAAAGALPFLATDVVKAAVATGIARRAR